MILVSMLLASLVGYILRMGCISEIVFILLEVQLEIGE